MSEIFDLVMDHSSVVIIVGGVAIGLLLVARRQRGAAPEGSRPSGSGDVARSGRFDPPTAEDAPSDPAERHRERRDYAMEQRNYAEAREWAEAVVARSGGDWMDWMELGTVTALAGEQEKGWQIIDEAVEKCELTEPRMLPHAQVRRALAFLMSWAPPRRLVAAVAAAEAANADDEDLVVPRMWSLVYQGRFDDAEELARRGPGDSEGMVAAVDTMIAGLRNAVATTDTTLDDLHRSGFLTPLWDQMWADQLGLGVPEALAALDEVMPAELRASLRRPARRKVLDETGGERKVLAWHDGQEPGAGRVWGLDGDFRLMTSSEIAAMDAAIEAAPATHPGWNAQGLTDIYTQVMCDDAGGYLITVAGARVVVRREGRDDVDIAPTLADFFWDRVTAWGGSDPRPPHRRQG